MAEIVACPACQRKLQVPEDFFGKTVQCPECKHSFTAAPVGAASPAAPPAPAPAPAPAWEDRPRDESDYDRRPSRRSRRAEEDDDDEYDDRRSRRSRQMPHRGGMILAFGILALFVMPLVFGPIAWIMGNADLREMRMGRMDPTGESQTNTGRILGMVSVILNIVVLLLTCLGVAVIFIIAAAAAPRGGGGRRF